MVLLAASDQCGPAAADVRARATIPSTITLPGTRSFEARLELEAGAAAERFSVEIVPPRYRGSSADEGSAVAVAPGPDALRLEGPGALGQQTLLAGTPGCSPRRNGFHGLEPRVPAADVDLPAGARSVLVVRLLTAPTAPWAPSQYRVAFELRRQLVAGGEGTLGAARTVRPGSPTLRGRRGLRVHLRSQPSTRPPGRRGQAQVRRGRPVMIIGRTTPAIARLSVTLRTLGPGSDRRFATLTRIRTDRRGRFRVRRALPLRRGSYELWAFTSARPPYLAADYACPLGFRVR